MKRAILTLFRCSGVSGQCSCPCHAEICPQARGHLGTKCCGQAGGVPGKSGTAAERAGRLAAGKTENAVTALRAVDSVRVCAQSVGRAEVLNQRRLGGSRQQSGRECAVDGKPRAKELSVLRLRLWRRSLCTAVLTYWELPTERHRS